MSKNIKKVAIILKPSRIEDLGNIVSNLVRWLKRRDKQVLVLQTEKERLQRKLSPKIIAQIKFIESEELFKDSHLILSLGGDGTLLGVARSLKSKIPVMGVNLGRLGFITEFQKQDFYEYLTSVFSNKYQCINRYLYSVQIEGRKSTSEKHFFFNDAVLKGNIARMVSLQVETEGEHIFNISGDGLIISSTYGSTVP